MSGSKPRKDNEHILYVVAAFVSVSMSIFFGQISVSTLVYENYLDIRGSLTIIVVIITYYYVFYSISKISILKVIPTYLLILVFISSILIILIGISDVRGVPIKILSMLLIGFMMLILFKVPIRDRENQIWYALIPLGLLLGLIAYSFTYSPELLIEDEDIQLKTISYDGNDSLHATLLIRMKAMHCDANNIRIKIICSDQITLEEDECAFFGIDTLRKEEEKTVKWNIVFEGIHSHSFYLYLVTSGSISNKKITVYPENGQWKARIQDVGHMENLLIFLRNNTS